MTGTLLLAGMAVATVATAHLLAGARWTWRTPRTAIVLWQALGLTWGTATIGALLGIGVAPYRQGVAGGVAAFLGDPASLPWWHVVAMATAALLALTLVAMLLAAVAEVFRERRRHRALLSLVATPWGTSVPASDGPGDGMRGALVLDHPAAAAYCVPGVRSRIVISSGTLRLLNRYELAAVLEHERAHVRERHDLVLLPFASLRRFFPQTGLVGRILGAVELLVEMTADDRVRQHRPARELATALLRFATAGPSTAPAGALAVTGGADLGTAPVLAVTGGAGSNGAANLGTAPILARVERLLSPQPVPRTVRAALLAAAWAIAALPAALYALPT